jgi:hypothetical protein
VLALLELQQYYLSGKGGEMDGLLQEPLGRAPITMEQFLAENIREFRAEAAKA